MFICPSLSYKSPRLQPTGTMPPKMSRKWKQTLEEMSNKKKAKFRVEVAPAATPSNMDDSLELPGPSAIPVQGERDGMESDGEDYRGEFTYDDARACYEDWLITLEKEQVQMMAMMLYDNYIARFWASSD